MVIRRRTKRTEAALNARLNFIVDSVSSHCESPLVLTFLPLNIKADPQ